MRLSEAKIKQAIVHPEKLARQEALLYFADCYSRDEEVLPLAIKAIEIPGERSLLVGVGASLEGRLHPLRRRYAQGEAGGTHRTGH